MKIVEKLVPLFEEMDTVLERHSVDCFTYEERHMLHFGVGLWLRNEKLRQGKWKALFEQYGIYEPDDQSSLIIQLYYLRKKESISE